MRIAMVGTGYVGLVSGTCFAEFGINVICVDKDKSKIDCLENGEIPIYEPGLKTLVKKQVEAGRLSFTTNLEDAVKGADAVFIAVGTPPREEDGHADMTYVYQAAREIARVMDGYTVIVTKSTVPVGTAREVEKIVREERPDGDFDICSNPEFLREGAAINDFMRPDRVVIGSSSKRATDVLKALYRPLYINETPMVITSPETSETIKYAANAFLATKITFINEIANLCEKTGANVQEVARGMGLDGRIGSKFLHAGPGYGGSCFPKDTLALTQIGETFGAPQRIVEKVVEINTLRHQEMADLVVKTCGGDVKGKKIAVLGISFKPGTDDIREAPSLQIIPHLQAAGAQISAFDPAAMDNAAKVLSDVTWAKDSYEAIEGADALAIITEWNEFRALDLDRVEDLLAEKRIIDMRNIYKIKDMAARGFDYVSIGRPAVEANQGTPALKEVAQ
ncbi:MAG: UDP-glucose 6-dehydrogenase [Alphaproteobacteria bacterium]|nr:UDP-glucose 6-dehydrogenase [Alphaproteobacteria bacterium]HCQ70772.1 UDP-glucose 6-dehydrogenase [Rhodospirillaceae bacterium]|tara:strand:- start:7275 stop:8627 length:1353 start_codon:yes stop_codon:yes gene_type:complete